MKSNRTFWVFFGAIVSLLVFSPYALAGKLIDLKEKDMNDASSLVNGMIHASEKVDILEVAERISNERKRRISEGINKQFSTSTLDAFQIDKGSDSNENIAGNQLVMFVSSSMPMRTLRNYARDMAKVGGVLAVRGMKGGMSDHVSSMRFFWDVLRVDPNCKTSTCESFDTDILIDPILFRMYDIQVVPALVYQPDMQLNSYCDDLSTAKKGSGIVYGDMYLGYLLEQLEEKTGNSMLGILRARLEG